MHRCRRSVVWAASVVTVEPNSQLNMFDAFTTVGGVVCCVLTCYVIFILQLRFSSGMCE